MLNTLLFVLSAASSSSFDPNAGQFTLPAFQAQASIHDKGVEPDGRWDNAGVQFLAGTAGATIGSLGGAFVGGLAGYVIGEASSSRKDRCEDSDDEDGGGWCIPKSVGTAAFGGMLGAATLGVWTTAQFVSLSAPKDHPSSGVGMGMLGSTLGAMGGFAILGATSNSMDWQFWPGFAVVMASSSAGALVLDRYCAVPGKFSLAPWVPRPGLDGVMLSMEF